MSFLPKLFLVIATANGLIAVVLGAFGAHALKSRLDTTLLGVWQTAVQYHFIHLLALVAVAMLLRESPRNLALSASASSFTAGIALFCGSLYLFALGGPRWLGPITPLGGVFFIVGWASLLVYAVRS